MRNLNHFLEVKPIRFFDKSIEIKGMIVILWIYIHDILWVCVGVVMYM